MLTVADLTAHEAATRASFSGTTTVPEKLVNSSSITL
jgi:hypothetical protein